MSSTIRFTAHTLNLVGHPLLKLKDHRYFETPIDELTAWCQTPGASKMAISDNRKHHKRAEYIISLKLFLSSFNDMEVYDALDALEGQLLQKKFEVLTLVFPPLDRIAYESDNDRHMRWMEVAVPFYKNVMEKVGKHVGSIGIAEVSSRQLRELLKVAKPAIIFFRMDPHNRDIPYLQALAREKNLRLHIHGHFDMVPVRGIVEKHYKERTSYSYEASWVASYDMSLKSTDEIDSHGYIIQLQRFTN